MKLKPPNWIAYRLDFPGDARREAAERRAARKDRPQVPAPTAAPGGVLRAFRTAALAAIALVVTTASAASFTESYRGLLLWAEHHGLAGFWAAAFPAQVDSFIVVGELSLFVAMADRWRKRDRAGAWAVALLGLAVSVAGNVGHAAGHDLQTRGTAAIPPLAAFAAMWVGLSVLKHVVSSPAPVPSGEGPAADQPAQAQAPDGVDADPVAGLLAELLDAVRALAQEPGDAVLSIVPADAESAALAALRATHAAGNPLSGRQLETRFGITRAQATKVRKLVLGETPAPYAHEDNTGAAEVAPIPYLQLKADLYNGLGTVNGSSS